MVEDPSGIENKRRPSAVTTVSLLGAPLREQGRQPIGEVSLTLGVVRGLREPGHVFFAT